MKRPFFPIALITMISLSSGAEQVYFDSAITNGDLNLNVTELFQFGPYGAAGEWSFTNRTVHGNQVGVLTAKDGAGNGGHGASIHLPYPKVLKGSKPLQPGNVLRFSCWLAVDPDLPVNRQDWQFALLKFEFYRTPLADPDDGEALLFDSDRTADPKIVTTYTNSLSASEWRHFHCDYTYDPADFAAEELNEIRPVLVQGDFAGNEFAGNILVDDLRVQVFPTADDAAKDPAGSTPPPPLNEVSP